MAHAYPLLDFPVYGLDHSWEGPRWLDFVQGRHGDPISELWLMHAWERVPSPSRSWAVVGTRPAERFTRLMRPVRRDLEHELALAAAFMLVNRLMPELDERQRHNYLPRVTKLVEERAEQYRSWRRVTWWLGDSAVEARAWEWAGGWAGFSTAIPDVAVALVGAGLSPEGLRLAEVGTGSSAYHFDAGSQVVFPDTLEASARAALGGPADDDDSSRPWHEDQLQLLQRQA